MGWVATFAIIVSVAFGAHAKEAVDLQIVFATDISGSINLERYQIQRQGLLEALADEDVRLRMMSGVLGKVAVEYFEWSGHREQFERVGWMVLRRETLEQDIATFRQKLLEETRWVKVPFEGPNGETSSSGGNTAVGEALQFIRTKVLPESLFESDRIVVDVSGDGKNNDGPEAGPERDLLLKNEMLTINGITIINDEPDVREYYEANVIGGPRSFAVSVKDTRDYGAAMKRKLLMEIALLDTLP